MAPQARRMAFDGHMSDCAPYGRTARSSHALLSTTAPSPPHLTMHCTADHAGWIRVMGLEARIRNPSRPASNPSLTHARGRRVCTPGVATCPLVSTTAPSPPHLTIHCWPCRLEGGVSVTHAVGPRSSKWRRKPAEWHSMAICRTARSTAAPRALPARSSAPQLLRLLT